MWLVVAVLFFRRGRRLFPKTLAFMFQAVLKENIGVLTPSTSMHARIHARCSKIRHK